MKLQNTSNWHTSGICRFRLSDILRSTLALLHVADKVSGERYTVADFDEPARELFIWSVLLIRRDMAMLFWDEGKVSRVYRTSESSTHKFGVTLT